MRQFLLLLAVVIPLAGHAQNPGENLVEKVLPTATSKGFLLPRLRGLASEAKATARDFVSFPDPKWKALTGAQIAAATADAHTSLQSLHRCSYYQEVGSTKFVIGTHPDRHKYPLAGLVEVSAEAVASH